LTLVKGGPIGQIAQISAHAIATMGLVVVGLHILLAWVPGEAIDALHLPEELRGVLAEQWGLDQPLWQRIGHHCQALLRGDLGVSWGVSPGQPVHDLLSSPAALSGSLLAGALFLSLALGLALAWLSAIRGWAKFRWGWTHLLSAPPLFLSGAVLIVVLNAIVWRAMEAGLMTRPQFFALPVEDSWILYALALVVFALGSGGLADCHHQLHRSLQQIDASPHVMASRAQKRSLGPHFTWALVIPLTSLTVQRIPILIGGLVVLDPVFNLNGIGRLFWRAAELRDTPVLMALSLLICGVVVAGRWVGQILEFGVDPRRRSVPNGS
jgi:peptide/nickel transport system permease protein